LISSSDRVELPTHVMMRFLDKESVVLNLDTECYSETHVHLYGLDETGTRMCQVVTVAPSIEGAYAELLREFDVEAEELRQNLSEFLAWLVDIGLLGVNMR
jgi:hypothetical protein